MKDRIPNRPCRVTFADLGKLPEPEWSPVPPSAPTNCPNCGAPLHGGKCEYCGTEFSGKGPRMDMKLDISSLPYEEVVTDIFGHKYYF